MFVGKDDGFTILELITAVGVLLIFAVTGFSMYGRIQNDSVKASLQQVARGTLTKATGYLLDGDSNTFPEKAASDYNDQQKKDKEGKPTPISVDVFHDSSTDLITVTATHTSSGISESVSSADPDGNSNGEGDNENVDTPPIVGSDTVTKMKYVCDADTTGSLGVSNIRSGTKLALHGSDGSAKMLDIIDSPSDKYGVGAKTTTEQATLKSGVEYTLTVDGHFELLTHVYDESTRNCLTEIERIAEDSGITGLSGMGGDKLTKVPEQIPESVTSLKQVFGYATNFDQDISMWDTSNVTDMSYAFTRTEHFNQPLDKWDVSNVTTMSAMFYGASSFNQPLNGWNTKEVTTMISMFRDSSFDQPIEQWDVSKVTSTNSMFYGNKNFNRSLNGWNTQNLKNCAVMFRESNFNNSINNWDVSQVTDFTNMFYLNTAFNQPLNDWDVSNAETLYQMFRGAEKFNQPLNGWDTSNVTSMASMFYGASSFNQDISMWNVDKVTVFNAFAANSPINKTDKVPAKLR